MMKRALGGLMALILVVSLHAQGITTASISGFLNNPSGQPVAGATVTVVHVPTNTTFTGVTGPNGRFRFSGVPVGGPYTVSATAAGYTIRQATDVQTTLGESTDVMLVASQGAQAEVVRMEAFQVNALTTELDSNTSGAGTVLNSRKILTQPTVNRAFADLMKTNPFVNLRTGEQAAALGMNSRFNSIMLDGAKINDSFGLNSSGLFSLRNPFSLDAIEQVSVSLTPYDIRQSGFAGLAMNVVSKSGTNEFHGSVYDLFTDQNWQGKDLTGTTKDTRQPLKERTYGFTLGGPILKDRLFFFVNWEKFFQDRSPIVPQFTPDANFLSAVKARIAALPGAPDLGSFGGLSTSRTSDSKKLAKIDWNIIKGHRLSVRYSETIGAQTNTGSLNASSFSQPATISGQPTAFPNTITALSSNFYTIPSKEKVWAGQLFNDWTSELKTQFQYSKTKQDGLRQTPVIFPEIRIFNVPIANSTVASGNALRFGTEISSMGNGVVTSSETYSGSADYTWNSFTFTAGADHEKADFLNYFRQGSYGFFDYDNLADFQADRPFGFQRAVVQNGLTTADISRFEQTGVFAQMKWAPTSRFNAMLGVRVDYLGAPIAVPFNAGFQTAFGMTNAGTVDDTTIPAPRLSFNYALDERRVTQIRGGLGMFLGRNPWVWISNSYGNFGLGRFTINQSTALPVTTASASLPTLTQYLNGTFSINDPAYKFDPKDPIGRTAGTPPAAVQTINLVRPGLKLPTVQRGNLAIDRRLPFLDAIASVEYIDNRQTSALFVDNMNLKPASRGIDGRQIFATNAAGNGGTGNAPLVAGFGNVIRTRNVKAGATQAMAFSLERPMKRGWGYSFAYTHTHATEAQTLNSSTANSNWTFNAVFNQNQVEVANSDYGVRDRVQASLSKEFRFKKDFVTTVSLFYVGRTGLPFSYVYSNDLNKDGIGNNDLVAVPTGPTDSRFDFSGMNAAQQAAYFDFLSSSGLSKAAGGHTVRNAFTSPWQNRLDLQIAQELPLGHLPFLHKVKLEVFADFLNFGSWLSKGLFNYVELPNTTPSNGGQTRALGAANYGADGRLRPTFLDGTTTVLSLNGDNRLVFGPNVPAETSASSSVIRANNAESRWKIQAGVRMRF